MHKLGKNLKKCIICLLAMEAAAMLICGCGKESAEGNNVVAESEIFVPEDTVPPQTEEENSGISIEEVIELALAEGEKYYDNLRLTEVHSYDNDRIRRIDAGSDGNREWWYVDLANEEMNYVSMLFHNDELMLTMNYDNNGNYGLYDIDEMKITCAEAVQKAKELGIRGGNPEVEEEWVSGYNFQLMYGSLVEAPDDRILMLGVIGISENGNFTRVDFDAATGEIVLAEERVERADGSMEYRRIPVREEPLQETAAVTESQSAEGTESDESLSEAEIQELFSLARQYLVDPEKLIEAVERRDDSPWSNLKVYEQEEWEALMTERYGDAWKEW